jgi:hypothetical protein
MRLMLLEDETRTINQAPPASAAVPEADAVQGKRDKSRGRGVYSRSIVPSHLDFQFD